ncbi:hypothetical protein ACA910_000707 [Epithemia clementina (nom. ined.)]
MISSLSLSSRGSCRYRPLTVVHGLKSSLINAFRTRQNGVARENSVAAERSHNGEDGSATAARGGPRVYRILRNVFSRNPKSNNGKKNEYMSSQDHDHYGIRDSSAANFSENGSGTMESYASSTSSLTRPVLSRESNLVVSLKDSESFSSVSVATRSGTKTLPTIDAKTAKKLNKPLYKVVPLNRTLTTLEQEFRNMLETFANYSHHDILSLQDERVRALFEGVAASAHEPAVYRAFEVLFEDLYPLRVAARVIYNKLSALIEESKKQREEDVCAVVEVTGLDHIQVEACRLAFVTSASKINGGPFLTKDQLILTGILDEAKALMHSGSAELLMQELDEADKGKISFTDLMIGLYDCAEQECSVERQCDTLLLLERIMRSIEDAAYRSLNYEAMDAKKLAYGRRYDEMLDAFRDWRDMAPQGEGRRMDVVRGCFVGAENEPVVRALRICYMDYAGLRLAAEIIFKLVNSLMSTRKRAMQQTSK